ncbi:MAG: DUF4388 domain-containing protein [Chloroflexota bacterium]|nr:DUF4388 domain-containing protein [Chloroflexota bacterium]
MTLQGSTNDFPLEVLLRLLADTKKTGELTIRGTQGEGALGLSDGKVVTAMYAEEKPIPALGAIFAIGEARFEFTPWNDAPTANLEGTLEQNLKRAEDHAKWLADVREVIPHDGIRFRLSERAADQGAVTFTPDRWRVVMAVNTQPDVMQLAENLHIDRDEALTTLAGLVRDGVLDTVDAPPPAEAAKPAPGPPPVAEHSAPAPAAEPSAPSEDWSAALVKEPEAETEAETAPVPTPTPQAPPANVAPSEAASSSSAPSPDAWTSFSPAPERPAPDSSPLPGPTPRDWSDIRVTPAPKPAEKSTQMPQDWSQMPASAAPEAEAPSAPMPQDWSEIRVTPAPQAPSASEPAMPDWGSPRPAEGASTPPAADDRLTALDGMFSAPSSSSTNAPASPDSWVAPTKGGTDAWTAAAPAAADDWNAPAAPASSAAPPEAAQEEDLRLAAMRLAPAEPPKPVFAPRPMPSAAEANEWGPPPAADTARTAAPAPKKGLFGGLFKKAEETAPQTGRASAPAGAPDATGSSRVGKLAAFSNALLGEYNSGQYGKGHVDERISGLLMRVDEQADPIDRPLPIVDDRLDVQALERIAPPEQQAVPYLALLVTTIYSDAEKAFGRDKAKRGYKAAQQQVFGGDMSALSGPDLAGKLPKV